MIGTSPEAIHTLSCDNPHPKESVIKSSKLKLDIHPVVFITSAVLIIGFVLITAIFNEIIGDVFSPLLMSITSSAG
jgi:hypothetical protein